MPVVFCRLWRTSVVGERCAKRNPRAGHDCGVGAWRSRAFGVGVSASVPGQAGGILGTVSHCGYGTRVFRLRMVLQHGGL